MAGVDSLKAINTESIDLENVPVEEVFQHLKCTKEGLTSTEVQERLTLFGYNKLEEKKESKILKFLGFMWNPLSWVMEAAAIMAIALAHGGGKPPDYHDFVGIVVLLLINSTISFVEENNAGNAAAALMAQLAPKAKAIRDGKWNEIDAAELVPGDIVAIKLGDIIPADARLLEGDPLKIDQSALTGESLPVTKNPGSSVYSGSTCKQGEIEAVVIATGVHTFFGKAAHLVDSTTHVGHFQKVLSAIGNFCICSIAVGMAIEIVVIYGLQQRGYRVGIDNLLVLLIGGIPIAMPTVLSVTMAIGAHRLAQQIFKKGIDKDMAVLMAARAARLENQDAIDTAIVSMLSDPKEARAGIKELHFLPFSPANRRTALTYLDGEGKMHRVSKGAPEEILDMAHNKLQIKEKVHSTIDKFAERGLRSLGLAYQEVPDGDVKGEGGPWEFVALLPLFDPPRHDSAQTIERALHLGVSVKMITGDQLAIAKETGRRLGMGTNITISQALIFVTRSRSWSFVERPGFLLVIAFLIAQLVASAISAMATWPFAGIRSIGWGWTGVIWIFNIVTYMLLDPIKFLVRYALSGKSWNRMVEQRTALTGKKNFGKDERMAAWATETRTQHGLETGQKPMYERNGATELNSLADEAKRRAELARMRELQTLKGKVESAAKLKGLDLEDANNNSYTI
ncbi:hypothetical protein BRARA_I04160 [Brassica rapa]|uniref:P-type H(+)-exporting transporter n=1 Tax=Brassica campestris TaxID=3711 RepID=A0A397Y2Z4_BRACM|nr:hypothetical protein BRARA_I04160 [Brassica rapa]